MGQLMLSLQLAEQLNSGAWEERATGGSVNQASTGSGSRPGRRDRTSWGRTDSEAGPIRQWSASNAFDPDSEEFWKRENVVVDEFNVQDHPTPGWRSAPDSSSSSPQSSSSSSSSSSPDDRNSARSNETTHSIDSIPLEMMLNPRAMFNHIFTLSMVRSQGYTSFEDFEADFTRQTSGS